MELTYFDVVALIDDLREENANLTARIAELEAAQRWVPVSERLPEDGKPVWVCTIWNEQHSGFLIDGVWVGLFRDFREGEITHWMPLPPNPESPNDTQTQTIVYGKESELRTRIVELEARLESCESALASMVYQFFYQPELGVLAHSFMSAEEEACEYLIKYGIAHWSNERKNSIVFEEVQE